MKRRAGPGRRLIDRYYRELGHRVSEVLDVVDRDGVYTYASPAAEVIYGHHPDELIGHPLTEFAHPDDAIKLDAARTDLLSAAGEATRTLIYRRQHADGYWAWVEAILQPYHEADGTQTVGLIGIARDVTERIEAEHESRQRELLYRALFEQSPIGEAVTTGDGSMIEANAALGTITGAGSRRLTGRSLLDLLHADDVSQMRAEFARLGKRESAALRMECRLRRVDAAIAVVNISAVSLREIDGDGEDRVLVLVEDLSERLRQRSQLSLQARLLDLANDAIMVRDATTSRITYWNRGAEDLYGYRGAEATGQVSHELLGTRFPEPLPSIELQLHRTGRWKGLLEHGTKDGRRLLVQSRWALLPGEPGRATAFLEINRDVSEREQLVNDLRRANRLKDEFLATTAQELHAPLTAITGSARRALGSDPRRSPAHREALQEITSHSERLEALVGGMLEVATATADKTRLDLQPVDVVALLRGEMHAQADAAAAKNVKLRDLLPSQPVLANADPNSLTQVIHQLLDSAVRLATGGDVTVRCSSENAQVRLELEDTSGAVGQGGLAALLGGPGDAAPPGSTGRGARGLPLARRLVELQGGAIGVGATSGGGTVLWVTLTPAGAS